MTCVCVYACVCVYVRACAYVCIQMISIVFATNIIRRRAISHILYSDGY